MQVVQELKFSYDTNLDPEIDKAVEDLVRLIHTKGGMIKDGVSPNRGGSTIVNRPTDAEIKRRMDDLPQYRQNSRFIGSDLGSTDKSG